MMKTVFASSHNPAGEKKREMIETQMEEGLNSIRIEKINFKHDGSMRRAAGEKNEGCNSSKHHMKGSNTLVRRARKQKRHKFKIRRDREGQQMRKCAVKDVGQSQMKSLIDKL